MDSTHLKDIREGRRGLALALYIDIDDEDLEDYYASVSSVLALNESAGRKVLEALQAGLETGAALEISDDASDAVSIVLASSLKDQVLIARMTDGLAGRIDDSIGLDLAPAG